MIVRKISTRAKAGTKRAGFTLAELLAVVAILAILAGVAIPSYMAIVSAKRFDTARSACKSYQKTLEQFALMNENSSPQTGGFPAMSGDLSFLIPAGLMNQEPVTPWGGPYYYEVVVNPNNGTFVPVVFCMGPNNERIDSTQQ